MKNILKKLALPIMALGMMVGLSGNAQAIPTIGTVGGFTFGDPYDDAVLNMDAAGHEAAINVTPGFEWATLAIVDQAMINAGITAGDYTAFLAALGIFPGPGVECDLGKIKCDIRLADVNSNPENNGDENPSFFETTTAFLLLPMIDSQIGTGETVIGALTYVVTADTPATLGLLGTGLMLMGYMAYRRRKA